MIRLLLMINCLIIGTTSTSRVVANEVAINRWVQNDDAGYTADQAEYADRSEIMHIVSHKGKLYAANGQWLDARWVIPPEAQKQSARFYGWIRRRPAGRSI